MAIPQPPLNRRGFLASALGAAGLLQTAPHSLWAHTEAAPPTSKSIIMVCLFGGPSHIDMYDLKPDAPAEVRGELKPIATDVPGFDICELMPLQAKIADKLALLRTVKFKQDGHVLAELVSGYPTQPGSEKAVRPTFGAIVSKLRGSASSLPPYVHLDSAVFGNPADPVYLGNAYLPFTPSSSAMSSLTLRNSVNRSRFDERKALLMALDTMTQDVDTRQGTVVGTSAFQTRALVMIGNAAVRDAFDVSNEPEKTRAKYPKRHHWLQALRLAEAGVSVITLEAGIGNWDFHGGPKFNQQMYRQYLPDYDQLVHAMVTELHDRGLDKRVALLFWGELGRTPRINKQGGRDHWPLGFALMAGGGFRTGQVIGQTNPRAEFAVDKSYTAQNVLATLYRHLDVDPTHTMLDGSGRPVPLLDDVEPIAEL